MVVGSNTLTTASAIQANADAWAQMEPTVTVTSVTVASPPVVNFTVKDGFNRPVVGLGNQVKRTADKFASYPNLSFSLAKLVPGTNGTASKWVSYIVTTVETNSAAPAPTRPSTDNTGTLVDNGDGTYRYTFYRDVTQIKAQVDAMTVSAPNNKVDLGDLTWQPNLPHRLTIQLSGAAPGTGLTSDRSGANTPDGTGSTPAVNLRAPFDAIYDFIPATGLKVTPTDASREIVATKNCENCHRKLGGIPDLSGAEDAAAFHGGARNSTQYCVVCHTAQRKYGRTEATFNAATLTFSGSTNVVDGRSVFDFPNMIHKYHMAGLMAKKAYNPNFAETTYPQDIRNCQNCHDGVGSGYGNPALIATTKDGDNWRTKPSSLACGACHDGINFATGVGVTLRDAAAGQTSTTIFGGLAHGGGPTPDESTCAGCHNNPNWPGPNIDVNHIPVTPPNTLSVLHVAGGSGGTNTNAAFIASGALANRVPAGAIKVTYDIKSVSRDSNGRPVMVFRMLQNGTAVALNDFATVAPNAISGQKEIWPNFIGAPSLYWVFSVPQDGIQTPADFNAAINISLRCLWNQTAGTTACGVSSSGAASTQAGSLAAGTGADAGYYVATLTGATIPATAKMLTGGMGYSYNVKTTQPLTQTNVTGYPALKSTVPIAATDALAGATGSTSLYPGMPNVTGGLIVISPNVQRVATGYTGRRAIVDDTKCNACHQELGTFTEDAFHAGQRNDGTTCSWCHTPNRTSTGWSADSTHFVHAIHASAKRTTPFTWDSTTAAGFSEVTYPGILNDCETCHLPGTYDFRATASSDAAGQGTDQIDKRQFRTVGTSTYSIPAPPAVNTVSPYVQPPYAPALGTAYGSAFSFTAATGATTEAATTTLVMSPTVTVCSACHTSADAITHFKLQSGAFYQPRSTAITGANPSNETCLICHGPERTADIKVMHSKNR